MKEGKWGREDKASRLKEVGDYKCLFEALPVCMIEGLSGLCWSMIGFVESVEMAARWSLDKTSSAVIWWCIYAL